MTDYITSKLKVYASIMLMQFVSRQKENTQDPCDPLFWIFWVLEKTVLATHRSKSLDTYKINGKSKATKVVLLDCIENSVLLWYPNT
jgi:hypothetical protein